MSDKLNFETAPEYVRSGQAAQLLGCHINSVQNWIKNGRLPAERLGNSNRWRIRLSDVKAMINYREPGPPPTPLAEWAGRLESSLELPAGRMLESIQGIIEDMKEEAK